MCYNSESVAYSRCARGVLRFFCLRRDTSTRRGASEWDKGNKKSAAKGFYYRVVKRFFDILFSALILIILSPIILISALLVKLTSKGPVIFKQTRYGKDAKEFTIYKILTGRSRSPIIVINDQYLMEMAV